MFVPAKISHLKVAVHTRPCTQALSPLPNLLTIIPEVNSDTYQESIIEEREENFERLCVRQLFSKSRARNVIKAGSLGILYPYTNTTIRILFITQTFLRTRHHTENVFVETSVERSVYAGGKIPPPPPPPFS